MNCIQALRELTDSMGNSMAQTQSEMGEPGLDPVGHSISSIRHQHCCHQKANHEHNQDVSGDMDPVPHIGTSIDHEGMKLGRQKDCGDNQECESSHVKDSLYRPNCHLRGKWQLLATRDQIRTNQLSWASEQCESSESDERRGKQTQN